MTVVRMWEATCSADALDALIAWLRDEVIPAALATPGCEGAEAFAGEGEPRLVLITRWDAADQWQEPTRPEITRAHAWTFVPLPS